MTEYIVVCRCSGMKEKALSAFKIAYPLKETPQIVVGAQAIGLLAEQKPNTNFYSYLKAISKKHGRYAYYIKEDNGDVSFTYDLVKGKRVA